MTIPYTHKNNKVLLIVPPQIEVKSNITRRELGRELGQEGRFPPLGLGYIAAVLRQNSIEVKIIDALVLDLTNARICDIIIKEAPLFVGITVLTQQYTAAIALAKAIKNIASQIKIILGGAHVHFEYEEVIKEDCVDFCVRGEGEYTMLELVNTIQNNGDLRMVKGITFKDKNGDVVVNPNRDFIKNLDEIPFPARDLMPLDKYNATVSLGGGSPFTAILASRGCVFGCRFCSLYSMWKVQRRRSVNNVLDEIEHVKKEYGVKYLNFVDDLLTLDNRWAIELFEGMNRRGLNDIKWDCNGHINVMSEELLRKMKKANCQCINYGIEFGNQRMLDFSGKHFTIPQVRGTINLTNKVGIPIKGLFMMGYPTETKETLTDTINLAMSLKIDYLVVSIVAPFPGTKLYEYCKEHNILNRKVCDDYDALQLSHDLINLEHISPEELLSYIIKLNRDFMMRPAYIFRMLIRHPKKTFSYGPKFIKRLFLG